MRLISSRSLRVGGFLLLEPAIEGGLHRCLPLLVEELLVEESSSKTLRLLSPARL